MLINMWQSLEWTTVNALLRAVLSCIFLGMVSIVYGADPVVVSVSVDQETITDFSDSCTGIIKCNIQDDDNDSLIVSIQISADGGATWMVPFQSDFFMTLAPGIHAIPFTVRGGHGDNCIARITAWDRFETSGSARKIPAGGYVFLMGSANGNRNEQPVHEIAFTHDFWMDTTEITANQFLQFKADWVPQYLGQFYYKDNHPVDNCFYHWAVLYCNWRSIQDGLVPCYLNLPEPTDNYREYLDVVCEPSKNGWRLPSEAEWEYACRAGSTSRYFFGNDSSILGEYAWYLGTADDTIHSVAEKKPNRFGLYDLYGSMLEITQDWYDSSYYESSPLFDPAGPQTYPDNEMSHDPYRVQRGGFFRSQGKDIASSRRIPNFSSARHPQAFRCVRTVLK